MKTYRHDLLQVVQGGICHANEGILVTWYSGWCEELPVRTEEQQLLKVTSYYSL